MKYIKSYYIINGLCLLFLVWSWPWPPQVRYMRINGELAIKCKTSEIVCVVKPLNVKTPLYVKNVGAIMLKRRWLMLKRRRYNYVKISSLNVKTSPPYVKMSQLCVKTLRLLRPFIFTIKGLKPKSYRVGLLRHDINTNMNNKLN